MKGREPRILVATEVVSDANLVRRILSNEFDDVRLCTDPDAGVADFESVRPDVLVLAFNTLEKAERYYLGLYRLGQNVHAIVHRTVVLCTMDDLRRTYDLCRREVFDDYVLFWPATNDVTRLPMAVHQAQRLALAGRPDAAREIVGQARNLATLESSVDALRTHGEARVVDASERLRSAQQHIDAAFAGFSQRILRSAGELGIGEGEARGMGLEVDRLHTEEIRPILDGASGAVEPIRQWLGSIGETLAPQLESARAFRRLAADIRPTILVVDDDELQHRLLGQALADLPVDLVFASSGTEGLGVLRRRRPDLILMDYELPDVSGVECTQRIRATAGLAATPVIMVTAHRERPVVVASLRAGANDFIIKPFDRTTLAAKLARTLGLTPP